MIRRVAKGFTLIELLVVMLIIGIAAAAVTITGLPGAREGLRFEAERVVQLLVLAREESQIRGAPIRFEVDNEGYRFTILRDGQWREIQDADLRPRPWQAPLTVRVQRPDGRNEILFGRDAVDVPFLLELQRDQSRMTIAANGLGAFELRQ